MNQGNFKIDRRMIWVVAVLALVLVLSGQNTQALENRQEDGVVSVTSWKKGVSRTPVKVINVRLEGRVAQYEFEIPAINDKNRQFRLSLRQEVENTIRTPGLACWVADLREVTRDSVSGKTLVGYDLLSVEGPGIGDNFPREEWAGCLCPIEKPNRARDGPFYPVRTQRRFLIEGFVLGLEVTGYELENDLKGIRYLDLRIVFS